MQIVKGHNSVENSLLSFTFFQSTTYKRKWWWFFFVKWNTWKFEYNKEKTWCTNKKHNEQNKVHEQAKNAYLLHSPLWNLLKILGGTTAYWLVSLWLVLFQLAFYCIDVLDNNNSPSQNHIQVTSRKIMRQWLFCKELSIQGNKVNLNPIVCPQRLYWRYEFGFLSNNWFSFSSSFGHNYE